MTLHQTSSRVFKLSVGKRIWWDKRVVIQEVQFCHTFELPCDLPQLFRLSLHLTSFISSIHWSSQLYDLIHVHQIKLHWVLNQFCWCFSKTSRKIKTTSQTLNSWGWKSSPIYIKSELVCQSLLLQQMAWLPYNVVLLCKLGFWSPSHRNTLRLKDLFVKGIRDAYNWRETGKLSF